MTFDLNSFFGAAPTPPISSGHGGARPNSGPKKGHVRKSKSTPVEELTDYQRMERAKADKETQLARQAKVKADLDEGQVVHRDSVQRASVQAFAAISQSLDSIGDVLERDGIDLKVCLRVMTLINSAKEQLMRDLQAIHQNATEQAEDEDDGE